MEAIERLRYEDHSLLARNGVSRPAGRLGDLPEDMAKLFAEKLNGKTRDQRSGR